MKSQQPRQSNFSPSGSANNKQESSETETEPEVDMTKEKYEDSIAFTFGKVK